MNGIKQRDVQKGFQQRGVILLALLILKYRNKSYNPDHRSVFNVIEKNNLLEISSEDRKIVGTFEETWKNSLKFKWSELKSECLISEPSEGHLALTTKGERAAAEWIQQCIFWSKRDNSDKVKEILPADLVKNFPDLLKVPALSICKQSYNYFVLTEETFKNASEVADDYNLDCEITKTKVQVSHVHICSPRGLSTFDQ